MLKFTGERIVPGAEECGPIFAKRMYQEHIARYLFASQFAENRVILDVGCGVGYGSLLLAVKGAKTVEAFDLSDETIEHAKIHYAHRSIKYSRLNAETFKFDKKFGLITCCELIEHVEKQEQVIKNIYDHLEEDGLLIITTPRQLEEKRSDFHTKELSFKDFNTLLKKYFNHLYFLYENNHFISLITDSFPNTKQTDIEVIEDVFNSNKCDYFVCIASKKEIDNKIIKNVMVINDDSYLKLLGKDIAALHKIEVSLNAVIRDKDAHISNIEAAIRDKDAHISNIETVIRDKDAHISNKETVIRDKDAHISNIEAAIRDKDAHISNIETAIQEREAAVWDKDVYIGNLETVVVDKDVHIANLESFVREKETYIQFVQSGHGWKVLMVYYKFRDRLFPSDTGRRLFIRFILNLLRSPKSIFKILNKTNFEEFIHNLKTIEPAISEEETERKLSPENEIPIEAKESIDTNEKKEMTGGLKCEKAIEVPQIPLADVEDKTPELSEDSFVSIVIPTLNAGLEFLTFLPTLRNQKGLKDLEIIVVDSGSTDETLDLAKESGAKVVEIPPEKFSHSYARNIGAEHANGNYILFMTQDALPPSELWLYEMLSVLLHNEVAAVSCAESPREDADLFYRVASWYHNRFLEIEMCDRILSKPAVEDHMTLRKNAQLSDIACLIPKEIFMKYRFRNDYAEDLDLGIRLVRDGYRIALLGTTRVIHSHSRPPYYYLKRGYVDSLALPSILPGFPVPSNGQENILGDIVFTFYVIDYLINEGLSCITLPCSVEEFCNIVNREFCSAVNAQYTASVDIIDNHYVDNELKLFLRRVYSYCSFKSNNVMYDGILVHAVQTFVSTTIEYIRNTYEFIDDYLLEDFKTCTYKAYANQCGVHLAFCYLKTPDSEKGRLKDFNTELTKGI